MYCVGEKSTCVVNLLGFLYDLLEICRNQWNSVVTIFWHYARETNFYAVRANSREIVITLIEVRTEILINIIFTNVEIVTNLLIINLFIHECFFSLIFREGCHDFSLMEIYQHFFFLFVCYWSKWIKGKRPSYRWHVLRTIRQNFFLDNMHCGEKYIIDRL